MARANWGRGASGAASGAAAGSTFGSWGTGIGGVLGGLMGLFGGDRKAEAIVPEDMQGLRKQNIELLMSLLGPGAFGAGGAGERFFGKNLIDDLLKQESPEMQAFNTARPLLEGMLTGTGPQFERDISLANQQGGRFGSANAVLRGEALRNLFNQRTQTAGALGTLAGQAGSSQFDRLFQAQNQRYQLLAGLLGMSGQATLGAPVQQQNSGFDDLQEVLKLIASMQRPSGNKTNTKTPAGRTTLPFGINA